jgi:hypothetical protein
MTDIDQRKRSLTSAAERLLVDLGQAGDDEHTATIAARLHDSVIGPLRQHMPPGEQGAEPGDPSDQQPKETTESSTAGDVADRLWELARVATGLRVEQGADVEVAEAAAALQDLALLLTEDPVRAARVAELAGRDHEPPAPACGAGVVRRSCLPRARAVMALTFGQALDAWCG